MRGKNVDYLESKNKSPLMKNKLISAYFNNQKITDKSEGRGSRHSTVVNLKKAAADLAK